MKSDVSTILYIGAILKDTVCQIDHIPLPGEGIVVQKRVERVGGCAYNMAMVSQFMGASYQLFVPIGTGTIAHFLSQKLKESSLQGVKIANTTYDNGDCVCLITPDGERTMITTPGIERHFEATWFNQLPQKDFLFSVANGYEIMGPGGSAIIDFIKTLNTTFVFGPGPLTALLPDSLINSINEISPIWHLNEAEIKVLTNTADIYQAIEILYAQSHNVVIVTAGANGTYYTEDGIVHHMETTPIAPVDTIGAGDSHLGATLSAISKGYSWSEAIDIAQRVSSCICQTEGAVCHLESFPKDLIDLPTKE